MSTRKSNMLEGRLLPNIILFALPILASSYLQQLFNSVDSAVVGRFAGPEALAAVGGNGPVINLLINFFAGLSLGANVVIARLLGQQDEEKVKRAVPTVMLIAVTSGFFLIFVGLFFSAPLLRLIGSPEEVFPLACLYLKIYFLGMPFFMVFNFGSAVLRSYGDTQRPLYALFAAGIVNVVLNLVFVILFHMGVAGVGIATVVSNAISAGLVMKMLMSHRSVIRLDLKHLVFDLSLFRQVAAIGFPASLQGMIFSLSNTTILSAVNSFGSFAIAGSAASINFENFSYFIINAFAQSAVTFTSQNYGAGKYDRCRKVFRITLVSSILTHMVLAWTMVFFRRPLLSIFTTDPTAMDFAVRRMTILLLFHPLMNTYEVSGSCLRGLGKSLYPAIVTLICCCGVRLLWVFLILPLHNTWEFLFAVYPITWLLAGTFVMGGYLIQSRKLFSTKPLLLDE